VAEALVLLHGFTQTGRSWDDVRAALAPGRYRPVLAPDLRGHGEARHVRPVTFAGVLDDLDALVPSGACLAGYSLGGRVALRFALDRPGRIGRLVLLGASPGIADEGERGERRREDEGRAEALERDGVEPFADAWERLPLWHGQPPEVRARARAERLGQDPAGLAAALRGLGTGVMEPGWDRLGELEMPVVLAAGARDARFLALAEEMAARIGRAEVAIIRGAGHAAHLEAPAAVAEVLAGRGQEGGVARAAS
jgi:2-succinyl-6-hydroxy-2,4-cyclohexadiene-1-carboxylate synthase